MVAFFLLVEAIDSGGKLNPRSWVTARNFVEALLTLVAVPIATGATMGVVTRLLGEAVLSRRRA
jgi:hypothetical protein